MKKAIIILMLAIPAALPAAVEWYPSVTLSAGYTGYRAFGTVSDEIWNMAAAGTLAAFDAHRREAHTVAADGGGIHRRL